PSGRPHVHDRLNDCRLIAILAVCAVAAVIVPRLAWAWAKAVAAGLFYGIADAAIKAVSVNYQAHGASALVSGWTALVVLGTFAGFLAFQAALRRDDAVSAIALM